jgi:hypothetical protein
MPQSCKSTLLVAHYCSISPTCQPDFIHTLIQQNLHKRSIRSLVLQSSIGVASHLARLAHIVSSTLSCTAQA